MNWFKCIAIVFFTAVSCEPIINTKNGQLKGKILESRDGRKFYSFTSIPYAKPPIGDLRFKAPEPAEPWKGTLDTTKEATMCIQSNEVFIKQPESLVLGDEDCLYLNIYTPNVNGKLPVMFWIHGGAFVVGSGGTGGPDYFMDKDVVLVSINYRLGLLGFLSTEDEVIPGNFGMKDQVMALRWVKENIGHFGGDPSSVTIFGESAGGASTGYHLLSPMSKGLFHKAILQSGTPLCRWAVSAPGLIRQRTEAAATIAGCNIDDSETILECMKSLPASVITNLYVKLFVWKAHPTVLFTPVVERCVPGNNAFICHHPFIEFKQESHVPVIIGLNSAEGGLLAANMFNSTSLVEQELNTDYSRLMSIVMMYNNFALPKHLVEIGERILKKYYPTGSIDDHTHSNAVEMFGDGAFLQCVVDMAEKLTSPVYFYLYDHQNEFSFNKLFGKCEKPLGVTHADELNSLFNLKFLSRKYLNEKDLAVSKLMINVWTNFASSDHVTIDGSVNGQSWPRHTQIENSLMVYINSSQPKIDQNPFQDKYRFWEGLPTLSRLQHYASQNHNGSTYTIKNEL
ncbi:juvenile hormone esterase-like [Adelges cooleyi]|uniref:juvenile hormone esterase-like n=1 Tax=Adelges cooleyi TaxID=133065 RepID=UPI00217FA476|nr:juvenile hormone esterase-like [Adelges cooleyi]XP_050428101.1 juvenile hormone esterase-like [Adelges cooleyi]